MRVLSHSKLQTLQTMHKTLTQQRNLLVYLLRPWQSLTLDAIWCSITGASWHVRELDMETRRQDQASKGRKKLPGRGRLGNRLETTQFSTDKVPSLSSSLPNRQSSHHATLEANDFKEKRKEEKGRLRYVDHHHQREREPKKRGQGPRPASTFLGTCSNPPLLSQGLGVLFELMCRPAAFEAALTPILHN